MNKEIAECHSKDTCMSIAYVSLVKDYDDDDYYTLCDATLCQWANIS